MMKRELGELLTIIVLKVFLVIRNIHGWRRSLPRIVVIDSANRSNLSIKTPKTRLSSAPEGRASRRHGSEKTAMVTRFEIRHI